MNQRFPLFIALLMLACVAVSDQRDAPKIADSAAHPPAPVVEPLAALETPPVAVPLVAKRRVPSAADALGQAGRAPVALAMPLNFLEEMVDKAGQRATFLLPDGRSAVGQIELLRRDTQGVLLVQGRLTQPEAGFFFFQRQTRPGVAGAIVGNVRFDQSDVAYSVDPVGPEVAPMLVEHRLEQVVCWQLEQPDLDRMAVANGPQEAPQTYPINVPIPSYQNGVIPLQSLPGAPGVIYLDFDGETGPFPGWGNFDAAPSGANNTQVKEVWQRVAEDYQPFNINITTDRKVFDNATQGQRQHCILTPTTTAAPGAGGVSYVGSFNNTGDTVNWSFYSTGKAAAEVVSHECGHALGLSHDGRISPSEGYYGGHGSGEVGWAPIMGVGYYQNLVQWSKGEYLSANNTEDDLSIIVNNNNSVDYRTDDYGATLATAGYLEILPNNSVANEGIIETRTDVDAFRFTTTGGAVSLTVNPVNAGPNLDLLVEIYNAANVIVATANPDTLLNATVAATLPAGEFTLRISGVGRGDPLGDGYTDYDSLGAYLITGTVAGGGKPDRFTIAENSLNGSAVGTVAPRNAHGANPLSFSIASGNVGGAFSLDAATGAITVANAAQLNFEALSLRWDDPATFQLFVNITDSTAPALNESLRVVVTLTDLNEVPTISGGGAITLLDHAALGTKVMKVSGSDGDHFDFPLFSIAAGNPDGAFAINASSGQITIAADTNAAIQSVYTLTVRATDQGTPPLTADTTVTVTLVPTPTGYTTGTIIRTYFENISGNAVSNLTSNANFPNNPNSEQVLTAFDSGADHGDNYGSTVRGYLIPAITGSYTFWIASDDGGELRLSPNATPASAVVRATAASATGHYVWNANASQQSVAIALTAGTPYYIEARQKEGGGADYVAVAWQGPGITQQVIPGASLAPYRQNYAPNWVGAPYVFPVSANVPNGAAVGTVSSTDINSSDTLAYAITSGNTGGVFAINAQSGVISLANNATLAGGQIFTLQLTVTDNGGGVFTPLSKATTATINVLQVLDLVSPSSSPINLPPGVGLMLETNQHGRTGTTLAWTKVSGPGTVTFDNAAAPVTGAEFSANGIYVLRCTEMGAANPIALDVTINAGVVDYGFGSSPVGAQNLASSHSVAAGAYTISASGVGIPSSAVPDDFYFIHAPATGDLTVTARIVSVQDRAGSSSRAGVMIRESLAADAREAFCGLTALNGGRFIYRATVGQASGSATAAVAQPYWVRLARIGDSFTALQAPDVAGAPGAFVAIGTAQTISMSSNVEVGIAAASGSTTLVSSIVIDNVSIVPSPTNLGPAVSAGPDAEVALPASATLDGTVSDDGLPTSPGVVSTVWSKRSGSGLVTFGDASAVDTTATFSLPGIYKLRLTANDGGVKTFTQVTLHAVSDTTVNLVANDSAASEQGADPGQFTFTRIGPTTSELAVNFTKTGTATAGDYQPFPGSITIPAGATSATITVTPLDDVLIEGPETVVFTLNEGLYNVGASDTATVTIADNDVAPVVTITSPTVPNVNLPTGPGLILEASATDDGLPQALNLTWSKVSGPGTVSFENLHTANTTATFATAGTYVLRLTASDGLFTGSAEVTVNVGSVDQHFTRSKVGTQAVASTQAFANGTYTLSAAGSGIPSGGTPDDFAFQNLPVTGDVTITARIVSVQNVNASNSRAGVMIRESLAADSREAFCGVNSLGSGRWIYRALATRNSVGAPAPAALPYWIKLSRVGNIFTAQLAPNNAGAPGTWTTAGTAQTLAMGGSAFIGLAATSGSTSTAGTSGFDNVTISPTTVNLAPNVNAGADAPVYLPTAVTLNGSVSDDARPSALVTTWTKLSGPGTVTFGNAALATTTANCSQEGNYVLRLIASDGEIKTFDDTILTAQLSPLEQWRQAHFGTNATNSAIAGNLADPDHDGRNNLLEYALGLDPNVVDRAGLVVDLHTIGMDDFLRLTVTKNPTATDLDFFIEASSTPATASSWAATGMTEESSSSLLKVRDALPISANPYRFLRLRVSYPKAPVP